MDTTHSRYCLWIDQDRFVVSFHPIRGYELLQFASRENYQAKIQILVQSGFRFQ